MIGCFHVLSSPAWAAHGGDSTLLLEPRAIVDIVVVAAAEAVAVAACLKGLELGSPHERSRLSAVVVVSKL
jgi:hypothetical protein